MLPVLAYDLQDAVLIPGLPVSASSTINDQGCDLACNQSRDRACCCRGERQDGVAKRCAMRCVNLN
eukprot:992325-Amphidinium_carterae.1